MPWAQACSTVPGQARSPTASSVVADLIAIARGDSAPYHAGGEARCLLPIGAMCCAFYLRIPAMDAPGVFGKVARVLGDRNISIEGAVQRERAIRINGAGERSSWVPIVILTDRVRQDVIDSAVEEVQTMPEVVGTITRMRVEHFD